MHEYLTLLPDSDGGFSKCHLVLCTAVRKTTVWILRRKEVISI